MRSRDFILLLIMVFMVACSSLKKQAKENYEKGNYEQAYKLYKKAYQKDKKDSEVKAGLKKAAKSYLNQKLVNLRDIKNKKSVDQILDEIAEIETIQKENKEYLDYNSQKFYGNELKKTRGIILSKWDKNVTEKNALKLHIQQKHYTFLNMKKDKLGRRVLAKTKKLGISSCNKKVKSTQRDYYTNGFIQKYCSVFGRKVKFKRKKPVGLVSKLSFLSEVDVTSTQKKNVIKMMEEQVAKKLKFVTREGSGSLKVGVSGSYRYAESQEKESDVHEYYESEPYETTEEYEEKIGSEVMDCSKLQPDGTCGTKMVYDTVTKTRPAVKYRQVTKYFPYKYLLRKSSLDVDLSFGVLGETIRFNKNYKSQAKKHDYNLPDFELYPVNEKLLVERNYLNNIFNKDLNGFIKSAHQSWNKKYCSLESNETYFTEGSKALLCYKVMGSNAYQKWLAKYHNLDMKNAVIKKFVYAKLLAIK